MKAAKSEAVRGTNKGKSPPVNLPPGGVNGKLWDLWQRGAGLAGWFTATNHKTIGRRYIVTAFFFFAMAGIAALLMRTQLMYPENTFLNADQYNRLFSIHGITMMFIFAVPVMLGVGIYFVPLMIGGREVAFPALERPGLLHVCPVRHCPLDQPVRRHRSGWRLVRLCSADRNPLFAELSAWTFIPPWSRAPRSPR